MRYFNEKRGEFDIFNDISYHVILAQIIDTAGNVNHAVSITRYWIYYSNYKLAFNLIKPSTTSLPSPGDPTTRSIMILYMCANIDNKYSVVALQYCSVQLYFFTYILIISEKDTVIFCNSSIICLLCLAVVTAF